MKILRVVRSAGKRQFGIGQSKALRGTGQDHVQCLHRLGGRAEIGIFPGITTLGDDIALGAHYHGIATMHAFHHRATSFMYEYPGHTYPYDLVI